MYIIINYYNPNVKDISFVKDYMDWIFHTEFGLSYVPIINDSIKHKHTISLFDFVLFIYLLDNRPELFPMIQAYLIKEK